MISNACVRVMLFLNIDSPLSRYYSIINCISITANVGTVCLCSHYSNGISSILPLRFDIVFVSCTVDITVVIKSIHSGENKMIRTELMCILALLFQLFVVFYEPQD